MKRVLKTTGITLIILFGLILLISPFLLIYMKSTARYIETVTYCDFQPKNILFDYQLRFNESAMWNQKEQMSRHKEGSWFNQYIGQYSMMNGEVISPNVSKESFNQAIESYCREATERFTCVHKLPNETKAEWIKWGHAKYPDYEVETRNYSCSENDIEDLEAMSLVESEYLFCIFEEVNIECEKEKRYSYVD